MKSRLIAGFAIVVVVAMSIAIANDKGEKKSEKKTEAKKTTMSCCGTEKASKGCSDMDMSNCDPKDAKAGVKSEKKESKKTETSPAEKK